MAAPAVRASTLKANLNLLKLLDAEAEGKVRRLTGEEACIRIEAALNSEWLPVAWDVRLSEAVYTTVGEQRARAFFRQVMVMGVLKTPLFATVVSSLLGHLPVEMALTHVPNLWPKTLRDCGTMALEWTGAQRVDYVLRTVPEDLTDTYLDSIASSMGGIFDIFKRPAGKVTYAPSHPRPDAIRFQASW